MGRLFGTDGVRGIANTELTPELAFHLGKAGAYVDAIYFCPHHPDRGFEGEIDELKIDCDCRKPKPGMLLKAAEEFNVNLSQSYMIGDSEIDVQAGNAAGCKSIRIQEGQLLEVVKNIFYNKIK